MMNLPKDRAAEDYIALAKEIRDVYHAENVIITLGEDGSVACTREGGFAVAAMKVEMVDQTGAGDGYMAAVTWRLSEGDNLKSAMEWASVYCGYLVTQVGSLGSYPKKEKISEIFANREEDILHD